MYLLKRVQRALFFGLFSAVAFSAHCAPWQFEEPQKKQKKLVIRQNGRVILENAGDGYIKYLYSGKRLQEIRGPNGYFAYYVYSKEKLEKIIYSDGVVETASPGSKGRVSLVVRRPVIESNIENNLTDEGSTDAPSGEMHLLGTVCQLEEQTGEPVICEDWGSDGGDNGGGGGGDYGGGGGYESGGGGGAGPGGSNTGGGVSEPRPWWTIPEAVACKVSVDRLNQTMINGCAKLRSAQERERCYGETNDYTSKLYTECEKISQ